MDFWYSTALLCAICAHVSFGAVVNRDQVLIKRAASNGAVGFAAHRLHDESLGAGQNLVFDKVTTNAGDGYNVATGEFTCPVSGLYFFTVNILSHIHHAFQGSIVVDGTPVAGVYAVGASSTVDDQSTGSSVAHCTEGSVVSVKASYNVLVNGELLPYTNFAGFLIAADDPVEVVG